MTTNFSSITSDTHLQRLQEWYPHPASAEDNNIRPDDHLDGIAYDGCYCVGGALVDYIMKWEDDDSLALHQLQEEIADRTPDNYWFPHSAIVGDILNFITYAYYKDYVMKSFEELFPNSYGYKVEDFFDWLGNGVTHMNDLGHFGFSWEWVATAFNKQELNNRLIEYTNSIKQGRSPDRLLFRTEDW